MYPAAYPHDQIKNIFPGVFIVHGSIKMGPAMRMNRNMLILQNGSDLSLINPVRMDDKGLKVLDEMGKVKNILRLGDFHGLDDEFYLARYQCEFWAQSGQESYKHPKPTVVITSTTVSPFPNSEFFIFKTAMYPEAALFLPDYKLLITTDSIQYHADWHYFTWLTKVVFKFLGFKKGLNIGPPWVKRVTPKGVSMKQDFEALMELDFDAVIAAHGKLLESGAKDLLSKELERVFD